MTTDKQTKMLERVRALLAKAEGTNFPEEADAFRAKADELMTAYAIEQWMVEQAQEGVGARPTPERRDFARSWAESKFRADLFYMFSSLARHCRCVVGVRGQTYQSMPVYGLASDLDYLDMLFTQLMVEVAKNLQPPVDPAGEVGHEVFKQRQAGTDWHNITRKVYQAGLVKLTPKERELLEEQHERRGMTLPTDPDWDNVKMYDWEYSRRTEFGPVRTSIKNRLANYNRRYVKEHGLQGERNYVKPEVYQRSFMLGFSDEIARRVADMTRRVYDASADSNSMAIAVRDIRQVALELYEQEYPPPPPVPVDPNAKPGRAVKVREVAYSAEAMSAGRAKAREANLSNKPGKRVGGSGPALPGGS
jgi:hypothetical protein